MGGGGVGSGDWLKGEGVSQKPYINDPWTMVWGLTMGVGGGLGRGGQREENWDNCNSISNKIFNKNFKNKRKNSTILLWWKKGEHIATRKVISKGWNGYVHNYLKKGWRITKRPITQFLKSFLFLKQGWLLPVIQISASMSSIQEMPFLTS